MKLCSKCKLNEQRKGQRYCKDCHNANMRKWRKNNPMPESQKLKDKARHYAGIYYRRGKIKKLACACGDSNSQMHHHDYTKPLDVIWVCRKCHLDLHRAAPHTL